MNGAPPARVLDILTSFWCSKRVPALDTDLFISVTHGAGAFDSPAAITTWVLFALLKLTTGILLIFTSCPVRHRRHYTPATEYSHGPPHTLRTVPSMVDLDLAITQVVDEGDGGVARGRAGRTMNERTIERRGTPTPEKLVVSEAHEGGALEHDKVKHYDADVLTKVIVYAGIGALSAVLGPAMFEALGWGA